MAGQVYKKDSAGIRRLLQSAECMACMQSFAKNYEGKLTLRPFIGYDRAICFLSPEKGGKKEKKGKS